MKRPNTWPKNQQKTVISMAAQGASAREMAEAIGRTRNAIIGWMWKHNVDFAKQSSKPVRRRERTHQKPLQADKQVLAITPPEIKIIAPPSQPPAKNLLFANCQYISADDPKYRQFCNMPTAPIGPYCNNHRLICIMPSTHRRA